MTWIDQVDDEYRVRAQIERMVSPDAKRYATRGEIVAVARVFGSETSSGRCEITFLDRGYQSGENDPLVEQTIRTDWLDGGSWQAEIARHIEEVANRSIGRRALVVQLNEHAEGEISDKGYRRIVWLEPFGQATSAPMVSEEVDETAVQLAKLYATTAELTPEQKRAMSEWAAGEDYPEAVRDYDADQVAAALAKAAFMIDTEEPF